MNGDHMTSNKSLKQNKRRAYKHFNLQRKLLLKGKAPAVRFLEKIRLERQGRNDGTNDMVRQVSGEQWNSSFISREANSINEYCDKVWGLLQIDNVELLYMMGIHIDRIEECATRIAELDDRINDRAEEQNAATGRKRGEEELSENQVQARRQREREKSLAPLKQKKADLEKQMRIELEAASVLRNRLRENCNAARMVCERTMQHSYQRIDVYWRAAMQTSPASQNMPVCPTVDFRPDAEEIYFRNHGDLIRETERRLDAMGELLGPNDQVKTINANN